MREDKHGNLVCNVCGRAWGEHGRGGNCMAPPLPFDPARMTPELIRRTQRAYIASADGGEWVAVDV